MAEAAAASASQRAAARRDVLIDALADHFLAVGHVDPSLRPLAEAVGTSDRMLLYYFSDKADLVGATLERVAARLVAQLASINPDGPLPANELRVRLTRRLFEPDLWSFLRLFLQIAALSAQGDALFRAIGEQLGRGFHAWGAAQLDAPDEETRARQAAAILIEIEGRLFLHSIGLADIVALTD